MKKNIFTGLLMILFAMVVKAQNVGIGTTTPAAKLEIRNPLKADVLIRSNSYNDTSQLIFSNRTAFNEGTDFNIRSIQEKGLFISTSSDLINNTVDSIMNINAQGRIGIGGVPTISAILDIKSTSKGILIPRLTTVQRTTITSPVNGLLVFDTNTSSFWFYTGGAWSELVSNNSNDEIHDADNNTKVQTDKNNANDDTIRFVSKGYEIARFTSKTLHIDTAGSVYIGNYAGQMDGGIDNIGNPSTQNVAIGNRAGQYSINGSDNVYVGAGAGRYEMGKWNTYIGYNAGNLIIPGTNNNNTFIGRYAGALVTGSDNIHMGIYAGAYNDGDGNIFIGNSTGGGTFVGSDHGNNNVVLGHSAGAINIFGSSNNILIGNHVAQTDTFSNRLYIHNGACDSTTALLYGKFDSSYLRINGDLKVKGEVQTPVRTGLSNMVPICYGNISSTGSIITIASTSNITAARISTGFYTITITGEAYQFQSYVTVATAIGGPGPRICTTGSGGGQLQVEVWDNTGAHVDGNFHFVVFKE